MSAFVALLRGVNVGGHAPLAMPDLRRSLEGLGLRNVRTYLQSGNAVCDVDADAVSGTAISAGNLAPTIEVRLERDFGWRVGVRVMSADDVARAVAANPFTSEEGIDQQSLHATFLFGSSGDADFGATAEEAFSRVYEAAYAKLELPAQDGERAAFVGAPTLAPPIVYLYLPHGYGRTKLNNTYFERRLGTAATTRNWRTILALKELSAGAA